MFILCFIYFNLTSFLSNFSLIRDWTEIAEGGLSKTNEP